MPEPPAANEEVVGARSYAATRATMVEAWGVLVRTAGGPGGGLHWRRSGWREWRLFRGEQWLGTARRVADSPEQGVELDLPAGWPKQWA